MKGIIVTGAALAALAMPASAGAATLTVDSSADNGTGCTLRDAIVSANNDFDQPGCTHGGSYLAGGLDEVDAPASVGPAIFLAAQLDIDQTTGVDFNDRKNLFGERNVVLRETIERSADAGAHAGC